MVCPRAERHDRAGLTSREGALDSEQTKGPAPEMRRPSEVKWFRLRVAFALGVLILLVVELSGHRSWLVIVPQALFIVGIIVTSVLDIRDVRRDNHTS
jgi:hypothetical protein